MAGIVNKVYLNVVQSFFDPSPLGRLYHMEMTRHGAKLRNLLVKKRIPVSPVNVASSCQEQFWQWSFKVILKASNLLVISPTSLQKGKKSFFNVCIAESL